MTRSDFFNRYKDLCSEYANPELVARLILDVMIANLKTDDPIFVRGFGTFTVKHYPPTIKRNPKTGEKLVKESRKIKFKPGKKLKERIDCD